MSRYLERMRAFLLTHVFGIVLFVANLIAVMCIGLLYPLIRSEADRDVIVQATEGLGLLTLLTFVIPIVIVSIYARPLKRPLEIKDPSALQKRRALNSPLVTSLIAVTGWLTAIAILFPSALINGVTLQPNIILRYALDMLFAGSMVFVITYFFLEAVNRRYFIPRLFPDSKLSECDGAIVLSIRARFFITYFAAGLFPVFLFYNILLALEAGTDPRDLIPSVTVLTLVVVLLGSFVTYLSAKSYETPLGEMEAATEEIRSGDFDVGVRVTSNDELGHLGEAINEMALGLKERDLIKAAHERIQQELAVAWRIQREFLPDHLPCVPGWQVTATLEPAKQTSGDFYDFIPLPDGRLGLIVADVTDKGVGAALYMALSRTLLRTYAVENQTQPELTFGAAHRRILADTNTNQFVTVFFGVLDPTTGSLVYSNAGHNPPYLVAADGRGADGAAVIRELTNTGPPLGLRMFKDIAWEQNTVQLSPGDVLVLYSDGITEAEDTQEDFFDEERLAEVVQANLGRSADGIQDAIIQKVKDFVGPAPQSDDMTLMVLVRA